MTLIRMVRGGQSTLGFASITTKKHGYSPEVQSFIQILYSQFETILALFMKTT
jgi:hypothetical protein